MERKAKKAMEGKEEEEPPNEDESESEEDEDNEEESDEEAEEEEEEECGQERTEEEKEKSRKAVKPKTESRDLGKWEKNAKGGGNDSQHQPKIDSPPFRSGVDLEAEAIERSGHALGRYVSEAFGVVGNPPFLHSYAPSNGRCSVKAPPGKAVMRMDKWRVAKAFDKPKGHERDWAPRGSEGSDSSRGAAGGALHSPGTSAKDDAFMAKVKELKERLLEVRGEESKEKKKEVKAKKEKHQSGATMGAYDVRAEESEEATECESEKDNGDKSGETEKAIEDPEDGRVGIGKVADSLADQTAGIADRTKNTHSLPSEMKKKRKRKKPKDSSSGGSSSGEASSSELSVFLGPRFAKHGARSKAVARRMPGRLQEDKVATRPKYLGTRTGDQIQDELKHVVTTYVTAVLLPDAGAEAHPRSKQELRTIAGAFDRILPGDVSGVADLLIQRIKSAETSRVEAWRATRHLEVVPHYRISCVSPGEHEAAALREREKIRLRNLSGGGAPSSVQGLGRAGAWTLGRRRPFRYQAQRSFKQRRRSESPYGEATKENQEGYYYSGKPVTEGARVKLWIKRPFPRQRMRAIWNALGKGKGKGKGNRVQAQ